VLIAAGVAALLAVSHGAHAAAGTSTQLSAAAVRNLASATLLGPVPASQRITIGVFLASSNLAAEDAYAAQVYDPSSANYGNLLDPDTFDQQFGVPSSRLQATHSNFTPSSVCGYLCTAEPGYEGPTGLGTPNGIGGF
jgi:subtilase family serine protease